MPLPEKWACYTAVSCVPPADVRTSYGYLCHKLQCLAPMPIRSKEERKLFIDLLSVFGNGADRVDADGMALAWLSRVDGQDIFPKLPTHLEKHMAVYLKARNRENTLALSGKDLEELFSRLYKLDGEEDEESNDGITFNDPHVYLPPEVSLDVAFTEIKSQVPVLLSACPVRDIRRDASSSPALSVPRTRRCAVCGKTTCPGRNLRESCTTPLLERETVEKKKYKRKRATTAVDDTHPVIESPPPRAQVISSSLEVSRATVPIVQESTVASTSSTTLASTSTLGSPKKARQARTCKVCSKSQCPGAQNRTLCTSQ